MTHLFAGLFEIDFNGILTPTPDPDPSFPLFASVQSLLSTIKKGIPCILTLKRRTA